jgi:E3 ubiquitin-protein ligase DOA10
MCIQCYKEFIFFISRDNLVFPTYERLILTSLVHLPSLSFNFIGYLTINNLNVGDLIFVKEVDHCM